MAHAQKPDFVFRRNRRVLLNRRGRQFSRLQAAEVCASSVVMLDTPCSEVMWRVLATHSIRQFPLHFPSRVSPCGITFQLESTGNCCLRLMRLEPEADLHSSQTVGRFDWDVKEEDIFSRRVGRDPNSRSCCEWFTKTWCYLLRTHYLASVLNVAIFRRVRTITKSEYLVSSCLVCLSVRLHGTAVLSTDGFFKMKFGIWGHFRKSVKKIEASLESDMNNSCFTWRRPMCVYYIYTSLNCFRQKW